MIAHSPPEVHRAGIGYSLGATLPGGTPSPGLARAALAEHFGDALDIESMATLQLLSSEVVTNCVRHAGATTGVLIELRAWRLSGCVHVEISTATRPFSRPDAHIGEAEVRGRGLQLVDTLSRSWGIVDNGRNTVWFKVDTAGAAA